MFTKHLRPKHFFFQIFNIRLHTPVCCGTVVRKENTLYRRFQGEPPPKKKYERLIIALLENELSNFAKVF